MSALNQIYTDQIGQSFTDQGYSHIIIDTKINSTIINKSHEPNKLNTIINLLINLNNYNLKANMDTEFVYKSLSKIKPVMEAVKFVPPVIKDDVIEN